MLRIVLDTDVMLAGLQSAHGASRQLLLGVLDRKVTLLLSSALMIEYEAVLTRSANLARAGLTTAEVLEVLDEFAAVCVPVGFDFRWRPTAADPDDDLVLETAINGMADVIATFNVADMVEGASRFGIRVERPGVTLKRIRT